MARVVKRMPRAIKWTEEHEMYRETARNFFKNDVEPNMPQYEKDGIVGRDIWEKAGSLGLICPDFPEEYGGANTDYLYNVIANEESTKIRNSGFSLNLHSDVVAPYILAFGSEEVKKKFLPDIIAGKKILAISMTEPGTGSDLAAITTTAVEKGDHFVVNGSKTFISNGHLADLNIVCARTGDGQGGISLLLVESDSKGYEKGRKLDKMGLKAQDTSEIHLADVMVPKENLIGKKNAGFRYLMQKLQQERLVVAISNMVALEQVLDLTVEYVNQRKAFGKTVGSFQNTRFKLAEVFTEQEMARAFVDQIIIAHVNGDKRMVQASMAKLACSEMMVKHVNTCLQFFGGYGYMMEYPIAHAYINARIQPIFAGTSEVMREIISKDLGI